ncbi:RICIN domain-containing protein [Kitasatospora sp. NPDC087315]|uniref:RICIN domain-containing protein n=1 Tax=Kitasatospora sp. NPDC087315 TaxID=3364069 RepID=UPI00381DD91A
MTLRTVLGRRLGSAAVGLVAIAGLALAAPAASAGTADDEPVEIRSGAYGSGTNTCLEVADWRTDDGAPVRIWQCTGGDNQKWTLTGHGWVNLHSGKCLDVPGFSTVWGTRVDQWTCDGGDNQMWTDPMLGHTGQARWIVNHHSGLYLDVYGGGTANGTPVIQWEGKTASPNQIWSYNPYTPIFGMA